SPEAVRTRPEPALPPRPACRPSCPQLEPAPPTRAPSQPVPLAPAEAGRRRCPASSGVLQVAGVPGRRAAFRSPAGYAAAGLPRGAAAAPPQTHPCAIVVPSAAVAHGGPPRACVPGVCVATPASPAGLPESRPAPRAYRPWHLVPSSVARALLL